MDNSIKFPEIKKNAKLCFVRKYRQKGITRYIFYRANIKTKVSQVLKEWLIKNRKIYKFYGAKNGRDI